MRVVLVKPVAVALLVHLALMLAYLAAFRGDASALVCADREKIGRWPYEVVQVGFAKKGYDGQFYYVLARDPWHSTNAFIDAPALRHSRILFPALGWLASGGGDARRLLWALPALNLLCIAALSGMGALWALHYGRSPMWGCLLPIVVNAGTPALRDLTDPLATLAAAGLVISYLLERRAWVVCVWGMAAVLGREQNAAIVLIVLVDALLRRRWPVCVCMMAVLAAFAAHLAVIHGVYGVWPFHSGNLSAPFSGIVYRLEQIVEHGDFQSKLVHAIGIAVLFLQIGVSMTMTCNRPERTVLLLTLAGAALAVVGGIPLYESGHGYTRVFNWMPLGIWLWSVQSGRKWPVWLLTSAFVWPCFAVLQAWRA